MHLSEVAALLLLTGKLSPLGPAWGMCPQLPPASLPQGPWLSDALLSAFLGGQLRLWSLHDCFKHSASGLFPLFLSPPVTISALRCRCPLDSNPYFHMNQCLADYKRFNFICETLNDHCSFLISSQLALIKVVTEDSWKFICIRRGNTKVKFISIHSPPQS